MIGLFLILVWGHLQADDSSATDRLQKQVIHLRSEHLLLRQQAETEILRMGDQALSVFPRVIAEAPSPLRAELIRLQRMLQIRCGEQDLQGTTFNADSVHLRELVQILSAGIHSSVDLSAELNGSEPLDPAVQWKQTLFWNALDDLCRHHHLRWRWTEARSLLLDSAMADQSDEVQDSTAAVLGAFRVQARRPRISSSGGMTGEQLHRIDVLLDVEPAVQPWYVSVRDAEFELVQGENSGRLFTPDARREVDFSGQRAKFTLNFSNVEGQDLSPTLLRGTVEVRCSSCPLELRFALDDPQDGVEYAGRQEVRLIACNRTGKELRVWLQIRFPFDVSRDSHRLGRFHREAWLEDESGGRINAQSFVLQEVAGAVLEVQYIFPIDSLPQNNLTFVYVIPTVQANVRIPFLLRWENRQRAPLPD